MTPVATLADLKRVKIMECGEPMVSLETLAPFVSCYQENGDMIPYTGREVWVRSAVRDKLKLAQEHLSRINPNLKLLVYYGYRHPAVQSQYYEQMYERLQRQHPHESVDELQERTNLFIAHPTIAGHPTGGAIDVTILDQGRQLDMGARIYGFDQPGTVPTYSDSISPQHASHRKLLHDLLKEQEFAPFYGEWWHFSYGDREWGLFYQKPHGIYEQLTYQTTPMGTPINRTSNLVIP